MNRPPTAIPPPPPTVVRRGAQRDARLGFWFGFLVIGAVLGAAFYAYLPTVARAFDGWLAALLP